MVRAVNAAWSRRQMRQILVFVTRLMWRVRRVTKAVALDPLLSKHAQTVVWWIRNAFRLNSTTKATVNWVIRVHWVWLMKPQRLISLRFNVRLIRYFIIWFRKNFFFVKIKTQCICIYRRRRQQQQPRRLLQRRWPRQRQCQQQQRWTMPRVVNVALHWRQTALAFVSIIRQT